MRQRTFDIRTYKRRLRERYKEKRREMKPGFKAYCDGRILCGVLALSKYRAAKTVLCYVSTPIEVNTHKLIEKALAQGKAVAVPYCVSGSRDMDFYYIESISHLRPRTLNVPEPDPDTCEKVTDFSDSVCILPGLAFDERGFRLGYGGGYYDRFLSGAYKNGTTVGICYSPCVRRELVNGRYDVPCDYLVTDRYVRKIRKPEAGSPGGKGPRQA